jgi:hypothetical protein
MAVSRLLCTLFNFLIILFAGHSSALESNEPLYLLIGVSGTLQDGFPLRNRLDYTDAGVDDEFVPAILIGTALVRGYKAYMDIKEPGWREYQEGDGPPQVPNAVVLPTGCREHANVYWIYAVDTRQYQHILAGEPRFLSITPDTGTLDLRATETDGRVFRLARAEIEKQGKTDETVVAVPLVTGVWFHSTYVESPVKEEKKDGTNVTSYESALALWAGVERDDLIVSQSQECTVDDSEVCASEEESIADRTAHAWGGVYKAIRAAIETKDFASIRPDSLECRERVRFGVSPDQARINYPLTADDLEAVL